MHQDLRHVHHVETSPRHQAPVGSLQREQPVCYEDRTDDATHVIPVGNYVIVNLGNYLIGTHHTRGITRSLTWLILLRRDAAATPLAVPKKPDGASSSD
jgi:hypothetical protein